MKITGEMLKSERINKNLSIQDIALSLKLSSKIITSIEAGNIDDLPAKTFVRGFVKSYAQLLKMDPEIVLNQFQEEMGSTNPMPKVPPPLPEANENNFKSARPSLKQTAKTFSEKNGATQSAYLNSENPKKIILMISIATILIVVLVVSNKVIDNFKASPITAEPFNEPDIKTTEAASVTTPIASQIAPEPVALVEKKVLVSADVPSAKIVSVSKDATVSAPPTLISKSSSGLEEGFLKSSGKPVEILLEAKKDTEFQFAKGDSTKFTAHKLSASQYLIIRSKAGLYLKAPDGSALKISVNGVDMGLATSNNKAIKLSF